MKNLIPVLLNPDDIFNALKDSPDFVYNVSEAGYVSSDRSVILIDFRQPYVGMLL